MVGTGIASASALEEATAPSVCFCCHTFHSSPNVKCPLITVNTSTVFTSWPSILQPDSVYYPSPTVLTEEIKDSLQPVDIGNGIVLFVFPLFGEDRKDASLIWFPGVGASSASAADVTRTSSQPSPVSSSPDIYADLLSRPASHASVLAAADNTAGWRLFVERDLLTVSLEDWKLLRRDHFKLPTSNWTLAPRRRPWTTVLMRRLGSSNGSIKTRDYSKSNSNDAASAATPPAIVITDPKGKERVPLITGLTQAPVEARDTMDTVPEKYSAVRLVRKGSVAVASTMERSVMNGVQEVKQWVTNRRRSSASFKGEL